jgi:hypothetical protein
MARSFASASSQYLRYTGTIGGEAYTVAGWVYRQTTSGTHVIFSRSNASNTQVQLFLFNTSNVMQYYYESLLPGTINISGATAISTGQWYHVAAVMQSGEHRIYLNGASEAVATNALVSRDNTYTQISGRVYAGSNGEFWNGRMAEFGIWSTGLTAAEVAGLAKGRDVSTVRPASLAAYYPMGGRYNQSDVDRWESKLDMTATGSPTWTDHPRIVYPQVMGLPSKGSGGGGGGVANPVLFHSYYMSQGMRP